MKRIDLDKTVGKRFGITASPKKTVAEVTVPVPERNLVTVTAGPTELIPTKVEGVPGEIADIAIDQLCNYIDQAMLVVSGDLALEDEADSDISQYKLALGNQLQEYKTAFGLQKEVLLRVQDELGVLQVELHMMQSIAKSLTSAAESADETSA